MGENEDASISIPDISETLLIPLYARAIESRSKDPIIVDEKAVEITQALNEAFKRSDSELHKRLLKGKLRRWSGKQLRVAMALRTRRFDKYCQDFLVRNPGGVVVELGCGLSTRRSRIGNRDALWYDLDFPEVIEVKKRFFTETDHYRLIGSSVLDFEWMSKIPNEAGPVLFIAEGLLMYLREDEVKALITALQDRFPGCELACEVVNTFIVRTLNRKMWRRKFQKDHHFGEDVTFHFGIDEGSDIAGWHEGIELIDEWTYFDDRERKLGWMRFIGRSKKIRKAQWVVHYRLH